MSSPADWQPVYVSLRIAVCSTLLCLTIGVPLAWTLSRRRSRARPLWEGLVALPLVLPPTVMGYYMLVAFGRDGMPGRIYRAVTGSELVFTWQGAAFAVSLVSLPLFVRTLQVSLMAIDPAIPDAARLDGAGEITIFFSLLLSLARRGFWAGTGLAFARALGDFGVTMMVGGNIEGSTHTMSLEVYDAYNEGRNGAALVFVLLLSAFCLAVSIAASYAASKGEDAHAGGAGP